MLRSLRPAIIVISLILALFLEWSLKTTGWLSAPFVATLLIFWFWRLTLPSRFWLAAPAGFFMDSITIFPFGTYLLTFFGLALGVEFLQRFFSNVRSPLTHGLSILILLSIFLVAAPQLARLLGVLT